MDALLKHTRPLPKLSYNVHQCNAIVRSGTLLLGKQLCDGRIQTQAASRGFVRLYCIPALMRAFKTTETGGLSLSGVRPASDSLPEPLHFGDRAGKLCHSPLSTPVHVEERQHLHP